MSGESKKQEIHTNIVHRFIYPLFPVVSTLVLSILITTMIAQVLQPVNILPFEEETAGGAGAGLNALFYLGISLLGGTFIFLLLKYKKDLLLKLFIGFAFFISTFFITFFITFVILITTNWIIEIVMLVIVIIYSLIISIAMVWVKFNEGIRNGLIILLSSELGFFLGYNMPTWSTILILVALSLYDIYAVKRGPIKKIVTTLDTAEEETIPFLGFSSYEWQIGLGDLVFYSMFVSHVYAFFGFIACIFVFFGIIFGVILTYRLLSKHEMLPGLPLAIFTGLVMLALEIGIEFLLFS